MDAVKRVLTTNLRPGMKLFEDVYTDTNYMIIRKNTVLTQKDIRLLRSCSVNSVRILQQPSNEINTSDAISPVSQKNTLINTQADETYFTRIQHSSEFNQFQNTFSKTLDNFEKVLNDIVTKSKPDKINTMLQEVSTILACCRNPLHLLDMMQCMRNFDDMTYTHSLNVALICNVIGTWLNLDRKDMNILITAGMLHDIGKLKIPEAIITKPGKLTKAEYMIIQSHPRYSYEIIKELNLDPRIQNAAYQHHERYDGTGYPQHLAGDQIDYFASIVAIADVYDAMTSDRCYRKGICPFEVIAHLESESNHYDPKILYLFLQRTVEAYINTEVRLSNGEQGRIVLLNNSQPSRPYVLTSTKLHNLAKEGHLHITELL